MLNFSLMLAAWCAADCTWWLAAWRMLGRLRRPRWPRLLASAFAAGEVAYLVHTFFAALLGGLPDPFAFTWHIAAYVWHFLLLPASLALYAVAGSAFWLVRRVRRGGRRQARAAADHGLSSPAAALGPSRREVLAAATAALAPPALTLVTTGITLERLGGFRVSRLSLDLPDLPPALDGVTVVHLTDIHIGRFLPAGMLERVADAVNALDADLIAFTGDLNDLSAKDTRTGIDFVRRLRARHGIAMVEGNHDVMADAERYERATLDAGLPLLLNGSAIFHPRGRSAPPVQVFGLTWGESKFGRELNRPAEADVRFRVYGEDASAASLREALGQRQRGAFPLLLAHHPHAFDHAARAGLPLTLAGHTHGGQIMLTRHLGAGPARFRYWSGVYQRGASRLVVANGVGNWFPLRLNAPQEIAHLTLRTARTGSPTVHRGPIDQT